MITGIEICDICAGAFRVPTRVARVANRRAVDWFRRSQEAQRCAC